MSPLEKVAFFSLAITLLGRTLNLGNDIKEFVEIRKFVQNSTCGFSTDSRNGLFKFTYVIVFKLDGTTEEVLAQFNEKRYAPLFEPDITRTLFKIGANFSKKTHNIEKWLVE